MFSTIFSLATSAATDRLIMRLMQVLNFVIIVVFRTKTFTSSTIIWNIEAFTYMPDYGLAVADTTLVGQYLGLGKPNRTMNMESRRRVQPSCL